ncbi:MAG: OprD family outer membrane porin [Sulfurovum sp.]|nr:OprD family outer membrane porin [Sulfurovum sp.]
MKFTKLSLVATLAISAAFAGGDIAPVEPVVETPVVEETTCNSNTTINSKAVAYYYTKDRAGAGDLFEAADTASAGAVTFDVSHKLFDGITANFSAVGYVNFGDIADNDLEGQPNGAFINVANLTANYFDTTFIVGRQLIDTPLVGGFDWLLAPGAFEAAVVMNQSITNLTLVGGYLTKWRPNNAGNNWVDLTAIDDGNNWTAGAIYNMNDALNISAWYYNVDAGAAAGNVDKFTAIYGDAGYDFGTFNVAGQIVSTDFNTAQDSLAYGLKAGAKFAGVSLTAAVSNTSDNQAGFVGRDSMYTSSWNTFASRVAVVNDDTISWKVGAAAEFAGVALEASYAGYGDEGSELDVIAGYDITDCINVGAVYSLTDYDVNVNTQADAENALEVFATYKF